jgi:hypothetical protein
LDGRCLQRLGLIQKLMDSNSLFFDFVSPKDYGAFKPTLEWCADTASLIYDYATPNNR